MNSNSIELEFGDGAYTFALPVPHLIEIQRKCGDVGIGAIFARVLRGCHQVGSEVVLNPGQAEFFALDVIETVRHGLMGGGKGMVNGEEVKVTPAIANRLVDTYVLGRPLSDSWSLAAAILGAVVVGYEPPKAEPAVERAPAKARPKRKAKPAS